MQVAESKGLPKLKYHLLPRTKGFWVTVQNLRGTGEQQDRLHGFASQTSFGLTVVMCLAQPQLCTTPTWTSETTRYQLSSTFWTAKNIMPTYMWGSDNDFCFRYCDIPLPSWGVCSWWWEILLPLLVAGEYRWRWSQRMRQSVLPGSTSSIRRRLEVTDTQLSGGNDTLNCAVWTVSTGRLPGALRPDGAVSRRHSQPTTPTLDLDELAFLDLPAPLPTRPVFGSADQLWIHVNHLSISGSLLRRWVSCPRAPKVKSPWKRGSRPVASFFNHFLFFCPNVSTKQQIWQV